MKENNRSGIFLSVIRSHKGILYKVANTYCKNPEDRKDLVQEIIIQLWRSFDTYNDTFRRSTWIYRIALNVAISFYRKEYSREKISNTLTSGIIDFSEDHAPDDKETDLGILQQLISELKDLDKAVMLLYLEEKSHKEISQIMGISETNVATKLYRIKNSLKQTFLQIKDQ